MELTCLTYRRSWYSLSLKTCFILLILSLFLFKANAQKIDSTLINAYPYSIGHVGFAVDSMEFVVGDIKRGESYEHALGIANLGKKPISFTGGKISKFVTLKYEPAQLNPGQEGIIQVTFEAVHELPLGGIHVEIAVESNDDESPYKFLYMVGNIIEGKGQYGSKLVLDTVPRLIFNDYNYDFGYLFKGRVLVHSFNFTNMGSKELIIDHIDSSKGVSIIKSPEKEIPPGGFGSVVVKVNTFGDYGIQHRTINIQSNDPVNPQITLGVHGTVRAKSPAERNADFCYE